MNAPNWGDDPSDATALTQRLFGEAYEDLARLEVRLRREVMARKGAAYLLKGVSIFGAIIVAAKIPWINQTLLGLVIAAAVGLDQVTSNHARLLATAAAQHACERLLAKMRAAHSAELPRIVKLRDSGDQSEAKVRLEELLSRLGGDLNDGKTVIQEGLREADLKALNGLYVDQR